MGKRGKLRTLEGGYAFWCPGCKDYHQVIGWQFNGDFDKPTFSPSVLVRSGHYLPEHKGPECWCTSNAAKHADWEPGFECEHCHSFVENGMIRFLDDCSHALKGQTVPLPDLPLKN